MKVKYLLSVTMALFISMESLQAQNLVWSDEFDYNGLPDGNKWGNEVGYIRNNELQYYTDRDIDNQVVRNGSLEIIALPEAFGGYNYTSASINTKGKFDLTYGTIEARMKLPEGQGIWPAFWTLGISIDQVGWPNCGEIDVMEHVNEDTYSTGTVHWSNAKGNNRHAQDQGYYDPIDVTQWHTYKVVWDENSIVWYVDDNQFHQKSIAGSPDGTEELHMPHYLLLNQAIGGNWPGAPDVTTVFPSVMYVDYVRVYQNGGSNPPPSSSIVTNPSFEDGLALTPWTSWGNVSVVTYEANSGSNGLYVNGAGAAEQVVSVNPNTTYTLSGFAKAAKRNNRVLLGVKEYGGVEQSVPYDQTIWGLTSLQFTTGASDTTARIFFYVADGRDAAFGDDFSIVSNSSSSSTTGLILDNASEIDDLDVSVYQLSDGNLKLEIIEISKTVDLIVYDINGQLIYRTSTSKSVNVINKSVFRSQGIYIVKVLGEKSIINKKVLIK